MDKKAEMERFGLFLEIMESAQALKRGESKIITCPVCGSRRRIEKSSYNGHIHSFCENEKCIDIIQ